jgi:prephenate dehydratase
MRKWKDGDAITADALNQIESMAGRVAKAVRKVETADATNAAKTVSKTEFAALVALANDTKAQLNALIDALADAGITE